MNHSYPLPYVHPLVTAELTMSVIHRHQATAESTHPLASASSDFTLARRPLYRPCARVCYTLHVRSRQP